MVALESGPTRLDPRVGSDQASHRLFEMVYGGLVSRDPEGRIIPGLATRWEILDEGRRYRFFLRVGALFHNGQRLTAEDVAWTFNSILDGTVPTPKRGALALLDRVVPVDPLTVDFVLKEPWSSLLSNLTAGLGIVPRGRLPADSRESPVGTGPYRVVTKESQQVTLEAFHDFWGDPPSMPKIVLREVPDATVRALELQKGTVHIVINGLAPDVVPLFRSRQGFQVVEDPGCNYAYLGLNMEDPILRHQKVRRALALAIDREAIARSLWRHLSVPTETMMPPGHWARNESLPPTPYDPEEARRLLDQAGYSDPDGPGPRWRFGLTYKTSTNEPSVLQAQIIQAMFREVGVELTIHSYEFATFYSDVTKGRFQLFSLVWTGISDPDIFRYVLHSESVPPAGANRGRYRNPEFDEIIERAAGLVSRTQRQELYFRAQEILARDLPYINLFTRKNVAVLHGDLEGYRNYRGGEFYGLKNVSWRSSRLGHEPSAFRH